jgi:hypothetical protein
LYACRLLPTWTIGEAMPEGDDREEKSENTRDLAQAPEQGQAVVPSPQEALQSLNSQATEQAAALYAALSPPCSLQSLQRAIGILAKAADRDEILAIPEIRARCIAGLADVLPVAAGSMQDMDILDAYSAITGLAAKELPAEYDDSRRTAYLESVKTGDLELLIRVESTVLGRLTVPVSDLQDAAIQCCVNALRAVDSQFEGNPVEVFLNFFRWTEGFDLDVVTSSAEIRLEQARAIRGAMNEGYPNKLCRITGLSPSSAPSGAEIDPDFEASRVMGFQAALRRGDVFAVSLIAQRWSMPSNTRELIETRQAALHGIGRTVDRGESGNFLSIVRVIPSVMADADQEFAAQAAPVLARAMVAYLNSQDSQTALDSLLDLGVPHSLWSRPDVRAAIEARVLRPALLAGDLLSARTTAERVGIDLQGLGATLSHTDKVTSLIAGIGKLNLGPLKELAEFLDSSGELLSDPEVIEVARQHVISTFQRDIASAQELAASFPALYLEFNNLAVRAYGIALLEQSFTVARDIMESVLSGQDVTPQHPALPPLLRSIASRQEIGTFDRLSDFVRSNSAYVSHLRRTNTEPHLTKGEFTRLGRLGIAQHYLESFRESNELGDVAQDEGADKVVAYLKQNDVRWSSPGFQGRFDVGVKHFGSAVMLRFVSHPEHSPEYCVMGMEAVVALAIESGLSPERFAEQILLQVRKDGGEYEAGSSYAHLDAIVSALQGRFAATIARVEDAAAVEGSVMAPLRGLFSSPEQSLASWDRFSRLASFIEVVSNPEMLRTLESMRDRGLAQEAEYLSAISMRPNSKVSLSLARSFIETPDHFFRPRWHSSSLGPMGLMAVPHLGVDGEALRDAIIRGKLDTIAALPACRAECEVVVRGDKVYQSVRQLLSDALGSQRTKIQGLAINVKELFSQSQRVLKDAGISVPDYLSGKSVPPEVEQQIRALAIDPTFGMKVETMNFKVAVHPKSAPEAATAGDETQCCMPFGDPIQNDYMTQPNAAHFTVQVVRGDRSRTVAQSVLTKDVDIERSSKLAFFSDDNRCDFLFAVAKDRPAARVIAADNVEVNRNASDPKNIAALIGVYQAFFSAYNAQHRAQTGAESSFMVVGKLHSDALKELPNVPNTYAPQNLLEYTDKKSATVGKLNLAVDTSAIVVTLLPMQSTPPTESQQLAARSARYITYQDFPEVAHVVAQNSQDSWVRRFQFNNLQVLLQGKDIMNAVRNRPNLSVGVGNDARLSGYLIAFEGKVEGIAGPAVVIANASTLPKGAYAAGALLRTFTGLYRRNYAEKGSLPPLIIQNVAGESADLFAKAAQKMAQALGVFHKAKIYWLAGEEVMQVTFSSPDSVSTSGQQELS